MTAASGRPAELVCAGRLCVDLYAEQHGADLAEVDSFRRYLGGSAGNICFGTARLGVRSAMLARVGNDQNGEFLRTALHNAGADTSMMHTDPARLTPLVMLAVRPSDDFPRLFHYADSADMATAVDDIDTNMVRSAQRCWSRARSWPTTRFERRRMRSSTWQGTRRRGWSSTSTTARRCGA